MNQHSPRLIIAPITSTIGKLYPLEIFLSHGLSILLERKRFSSENRFIVLAKYRLKCYNFC